MAEGVRDLFKELRGRAAAWLRRQQLAAAYGQLFTSIDGTLVLNDLLREAGVLETSMSAEPHETSFREGKRAMALYILDKLRWAPGELAALAQERTADQMAELAGAQGEAA